MDLPPAGSAAAAPAPELDEVDEGEHSPAARSVALANEAAALFKSGRYGDCLEVLNQLPQKKDADPKVLHNVAITEFFLDGCSDPKKLLDVLRNLKIRAAHNAANAADSASGGLDTVSDANQESGESSTSTEYTIATFNTAVVLYHLHEYDAAFSILNPLYRQRAQIDEVTALHICLLLLDVSFACRNASKALEIIEYLEKHFCATSGHDQTDNGIISQQKHLSKGKSPAKANGPANDAGITETGINSDGNASDDTLEYESLFAPLDSTVQRPSSTEPSRTFANQAAAAFDLKLKLQLYKVRLLLVTWDLKAAEAEAEVAATMAQGRDLSIDIFLKAQVQIGLGNQQSAVKLLRSLSNSSEPLVQAMLNNNFWCIYQVLGMHHTSNLFCNKALQQCLLFRRGQPSKITNLSQDKSHLIFYNCGLQHLVCRRPLIAASCFYKALPAFRGQMLFWLRLAECCLLALEMGDGGSSDKKVPVAVIGEGIWRQCVICPNRATPSLDVNDVTTNEKPQNLVSLPIARRCLLNALLILDSHSEKSTIPDESSPQSSDSHLSSAEMSNCQETANLNPELQISVTSYNDSKAKENIFIKQIILVNLAYVELCLGNPLRALSTARQLEQMPICINFYSYLSHVYAAEALCHLNRGEEAAEKLSAFLLRNKDVDNVLWRDADPDADQKGKSKYLRAQGFPTPEEVRGTLYVNLGMLAAAQGDLEQSSSLVKQGCALLPGNPKALLAAVYLDLRQQKTQDAISKLKECRNVRFFSPNPCSQRQ